MCRGRDQKGRMRIAEPTRTFTSNDPAKRTPVASVVMSSGWRLGGVFFGGGRGACRHWGGDRQTAGRPAQRGSERHESSLEASRATPVHCLVVRSKTASSGFGRKATGRIAFAVVSEPLTATLRWPPKAKPALPPHPSVEMGAGVIGADEEDEDNEEARVVCGRGLDRGRCKKADATAAGRSSSSTSKARGFGMHGLCVRAATLFVCDEVKGAPSVIIPAMQWYISSHATPTLSSDANQPSKQKEHPF